MAGGDKFMKPGERGKRNPLSNDTGPSNNGPIVNPPRMAAIGGFKSDKKGMAKNTMRIHKPGGMNG
jgi:hypothetical protein